MFSLRTYTYIWIGIAAFLGFENYALNHNLGLSFLADLKRSMPTFKDLNLSPQPGKQISLWLGWGGLGIMSVTNLYIMRKNWAFMQKWGSLAGWLDFHIFCGLVGPTFILFHTNFKVGGLVAISFWSMVISFSSGVVGKYFYRQIVHRREELEQMAQKTASALPQITEPLKLKILALAGAPAGATGGTTSLLASMFRTIMGDIRLNLSLGTLIPDATPTVRYHVRQFAVTKRRALYLDQFRQIMGYWHTFHKPFAVFMYLVAFIHVTAALLFHT